MQRERLISARGSRWAACRGMLAVQGLLLVSCGSIGEPLPPLLHIPERVLDFQARQQGSELIARWTRPERTTDGANLREPAAVVVYALDIASDSPPPPLDVFERLAESVAESVAESEGESEGANVARVALDRRYGKRTAFAARVLSARGKLSAWTDLVILDVVRPGAVPGGLDAEAHETAIRLVWEDVERATGYLIERRIEDEDAFRPIGRAETAAFEDRAFVWDREHVYRVRSQVASASGAVASEASEEKSITPVDVFPPAAPTGLRAVVTENTVELTWDAHTASDLAGYRLLRSGEPAHEGLLKAPAFSAPRRSEGPTDSYTVIAVDRSGNAGAPSEPLEAR